MKVSIVRSSFARCPSIVCQHSQTTPPLKPRSRFFSVVAMATYSSHRLIMGKEEIDNFFFLIVDICIFFYRNVYSVVLYVSYDFCLNR